jgi:hypothetical protein
MGIRAQADRIGMYRTCDFLEGLLAKVSELDRGPCRKPDRKRWVKRTSTGTQDRRLSRERPF